MHKSMSNEGEVTELRKVTEFRTFLINMDRSPDRLERATLLLKQNGFTAVERWRAVDASNDDLDAAWRVHGSPTHDPWDPEFQTYKGKQGCMLSHIGIWKHMIDANIPIANVFEDDIAFHPMWRELSPVFYRDTPRDFDILYLGSKHPSDNYDHIQVAPVYCTHAYTITNQGAHKLYMMLLRYPNGVSTIDNMIHAYMRHAMVSKVYPVVWYAWNATGYPCSEADMPGDFKWRNAGLVFQDCAWPSNIKADY